MFPLIVYFSFCFRDGVGVLGRYAASPISLGTQGPGLETLAYISENFQEKMEE